MYTLLGNMPVDHIKCTHSTPNVTHTLGQVEAKHLCPNPTTMSSLSHLERANNKCQSKPASQRKACLQVKPLSVYPNNKKPKQQKRELCIKHEHVGKALNGISADFLFQSQQMDVKKWGF
jgi:hypothetical protein